MEITLFYVPFPNRQSALDVIKKLIDSRLIACGNVVDASSSYRWEGSIQTEEESLSILKTMPSLAVKVAERIKDLHPYDIPAIIHWNVAVNESYYNWVKNEVTVNE